MKAAAGLSRNTMAALTSDFGADALERHVRAGSGSRSERAFVGVHAAGGNPARRRVLTRTPA